jgi:arylsulfatase A-like enzyme
MKLEEGYRPGELDDKPKFYREARDVEFGPSSGHGGGNPGTDWAAFDDGYGIPCAYRRDDIEGREHEAMQATLGMVGFIDHGVGRILRTLEAAGELENTIIIYTSDHGELHGHHGFWHKGLFAYEDVQRVPLLVWGPGRVNARGTVQALANLVDLPRTILSAAGVNIPVGMQGVDLAPILAGERESVQDATIIELEATRNVYQQTLVTPRYKLVVYRDSDEGELYDLAADSDQYTNLWSDAGSAELRAGLLLELVQQQMRREGRAPERGSFA